MTDHFHVTAVQDWGGSQERMYGFDDHLTRAEADQLAADMAEADAAYLGGPCDGTDIARYEAAREKFGERFGELVSGNVCPGWNAIWVTPCGDPWASPDGDSCQFKTLMGSRPEAWGKPFWTPKGDAPEDEMTEEENAAYQRGFAEEHVRKGFYGDEDLQLLGITREEAEAYQRERTISALADRHRNDPAVLREALIRAVKETQARTATLTEVGGRVDGFGQIVFENARVTLYPVFNEYEVDVVTAQGAFGFDVPVDKVTARTKDAPGPDRGRPF